MLRIPLLTAVFLACTGAAATADVFHDYENFAEGFLGELVVHDGVTYRDANRVSGFTPDGQAFGPNDLGSELIIEQATFWYDDFPTYGSRDNVLTFGSAYVPGPNLSLGALASIWMDLDGVGNAVSLDLGYYENGPWGRIEYVLEARRGGNVVATDSFEIADGGGRDNGAFRTLSISGVEFDQLHLYGWLNGNYTAPRGIVDDLSITAAAGPGDLNCDGVLDAFDIEPFILALLDPVGYAAAYPDCDRDLADINGDGVVDAFDIEPFVALLVGP
jgi:hypothetical protein